MTENILDEPQIQQPSKRRKDLLPGWIKVFSWLFLIAGLLVPAIFIIGLTNGYAELSLYGFETSRPFSIIGFSIITLFLLKGIVAYGLLWEQDWAVNLAKIDAIIGIIICLAVMIIFPLLFDSNQISFRLEIALLIPYFYKMTNISAQWSELRRS